MKFLKVRINQFLSYLKNKNENFDYLFFCPESLVTPHFTIIKLLAQCAEDESRKAKITKCWNLFSRCVSLGSINCNINASDNEKKNVCFECYYKRQKYFGINKISEIWMPKYWDSKKQEILNAALLKFDNDPFSKIYNNISFGKLCSMDLALACKVSNFKKTTELEKNLWRQLVETSLKTYLCVEEVLKKNKVQNLIYFNDYAQNISAALAARNAKIKITAITQASNKNIDRTKVIIRPTFTAKYLPRPASEWINWRSLPLSQNQIHEISEDILLRLKGAGSHIYSPKIFESVDCKNKQKSSKKIVVFTSSLDEVSANFLQKKELGIKSKFKSPFGDNLKEFHIKWLQELKKWVLKNKGYTMIVRIHPREGPNKRENYSSDHLINLRKKIKPQTNKFEILWPEDKISSYAIACDADLVLTSWSTIGLEFARLGIPVLSATNGISGFPNETFHYWTRNKKKYFQKIKELAKKKLSFSQIKLAFRYWHYFTLAGAIDLSDLIKESDNCDDVSYIRPKNIDQILQSLDHLKTPTEINLVNQKNSCFSSRMESKYIKKALQKVGMFFVLGEGDKPRSIVYKKVTYKNVFDKIRKKNKIFVWGNQIYFLSENKVKNINNPLASRLLKYVA